MFLSAIQANERTATVAGKVNEAGDAEPLVSPQAHPEFLTAAAKVNDLQALADAARRDRDDLMRRHAIVKPDPRKAASLRLIGQTAAADAYDRVEELAERVAVVEDAVTMAAAERDVVRVRLGKELSTEAYFSHYLPAAKAAAAAYLDMIAAFDRANAVRHDLQSRGLADGALRQGLPGDFPNEVVASGNVRRFGPGPLHGLVKPWIAAGIITPQQARDAVPDGGF